MAEQHLTANVATDSKSEAINLLRSVAQQHLQKINEERIQEQEDEIKKNQDLERYAKHKRHGKQGTVTSEGDTPLPKMRSAQG